METIIDINKNVYKNDRSFTKYKNIKNIVKEDEIELRNLSSMNNYFVFKKV